MILLWISILNMATRAHIKARGYSASCLLFTNIKGVHRSPYLVSLPDQCLGGYCIACSTQKNSKSSVFGLTELCTNASSDNNRYQLGLIQHQANILRRLLKTLSQGPVHRSLFPIIYYTTFLFLIMLPSWELILRLILRIDLSLRGY